MNSIQSPIQTNSQLDDHEDIKQYPNKRKYIPVDYDSRKKLLKIIAEENLTIKAAAERVGINYSSAKNIFKVYKKEHRIEKLPKRPKLTLRQVTSPFYSRDSIPLKAALLPFYDYNEAQQFINWSKDRKGREGAKEEPKIGSNLSSSSRTELPAKSIPKETNINTFNFESYLPIISYRFFFV